MVDTSRTLPLILMALAALMLAGCVVRPYDYLHTQAKIEGNDRPPHESWCYETLGQIDCYVQPQRGMGNRLVNVDPQGRYPLTPQEHSKAVNSGQ